MTLNNGLNNIRELVCEYLVCEYLRGKMKEQRSVLGILKDQQRCNCLELSELYKALVTHYNDFSLVKQGATADFLVDEWYNLINI